jgi:hypothetical protein
LSFGITNPFPARFNYYFTVISFDWV